MKGLAHLITGADASLRSESALGSRRRPVCEFFQRDSPNPPCSPKSLPVAFPRSDMFKSAVVSACLMMTGKFAGLGVHGGNVPRDQRPPTLESESPAAYRVLKAARVDFHNSRANGRLVPASTPSGWRRVEPQRRMVFRKNRTLPVSGR